MSEVKQAGSGFSKDDVLQIIDAVRKPVKSEKEVQAEAEKQAERATMREIYRQKDANKAADQSSCQHEHETGVGTPVVYIVSLNRLYCQHCALWIFSSAHEAAQYGSLVAPEKHPVLWNRLFAKAMASGLA